MCYFNSYDNNDPKVAILEENLAQSAEYAVWNKYSRDPL